MAKKNKTEKTKNYGHSPINLQVGWVRSDSLKDAKDYAKGVIKSRFKAHDACWYNVLKYQEGYLFEVHEGGSGKGYLKSIAAALDDGAGAKHWFAVDDRAYVIEMEEGRPIMSLYPPGDKSLEFFNSSIPQLTRTFQLLPFVNKGTGVLVAGSVLFGAAALFFCGSLVFYGLSYNPGPSVRKVAMPNMPHMQWDRVNEVGIEEIVSKLEVKNGDKWSVEKREHKVEGLDKIKKLREELSRLNQQTEERQDADKKSADDARFKGETEQLRTNLNKITGVEPPANQTDEAGASKPVVIENNAPQSPAKVVIPLVTIPNNGNVK